MTSIKIPSSKNYPITNKGHYLANASIAGIHKDVHEAQQKWIDDSMYLAGINDERYFEILEETRSRVADYFGAKTNEVGFVPNSSYAFNMMAMLLKQQTHKRKVLLPLTEFPTTYLPWEYHGFEVIPVTPKNDYLTITDFTSLIDNEIAAVACSGILSFNGQKLPILELGKELQSMNVPFFVNHTQQAGVYDLHWKEAALTGCCFSCHKRFAACMGTSVFILKEDFFQDLQWPLYGWTSVSDPWAMKNQGTHPRMEVSALELGSMPFSNIAGINKAVEILQDSDINQISERVNHLTRELITVLKSYDLEILSPIDTPELFSGIISFRPKSSDAHTLVEELKKRSIFVNQRKDFIRVSLHHYNNSLDIKALDSALSELLPR